jgi:hypothetical protein
MGEITWKKKYLAVNSESKRACGSSRHGWKDNKEPFGELLVDCDDFSISGAYECLVASQE